jgi:hydrogenase/urease accessory protein HupE
MPRLLVLFYVLAGPSVARAHKDPVTHLNLAVEGRQVVLELRAFANDVAPLIGLAAGQRRVPVRQFLDHREQVVQALETDITVYLGEATICPLLDGKVEAERGNRLRVTLHHKCPRAPEQLQVQYDLFFDDVPNHLAHITVKGQPRHRFTFTPGRRIFILDAEISLLDHAWGFLWLGFKHIFTGYDHMLFLLALLLVAGVQGKRGGFRSGLRYLVAIVSAFTIAHSITLAGSALRYINLPHRAVDAAISFSIVCVAVENLTSDQPRRRWILTFVFGLVHGFGFATTLRLTGLPRQGLLLSLVSFNIGVEVGQLFIVGLVFPLIMWLASRRERLYQLCVLPWGSVLIGICGVGWFFYRLY